MIQSNTDKEPVPFWLSLLLEAAKEEYRQGTLIIEDGRLVRGKEKEDTEDNSDFVGTKGNKEGISNSGRTCNDKMSSKQGQKILKAGENGKEKGETNNLSWA